MIATLMCLSLLLTSAVVSATSREPRCSRGKPLGSCPGRDPRWIFDAASGTCQARPGGCPTSSRNYNNFNSRSECESACMSSSEATRDAMQMPRGYIQIGRQNREQGRRTNDDQLPVPGKCTLPPNRGPCRARFEKWYFNEETGRCDTFIYGGCRGNPNRFDSEAHCQTECVYRRT